MGDCSEACSKVTVPLTLESPRRTATAWIERDQCLFTDDIVAGGG